MIRIVTPSHNIILELDENAHAGYDLTDERNRAQSTGGDRQMP